MFLSNRSFSPSQIFRAAGHCGIVAQFDSATLSPTNPDSSYVFYRLRLAASLAGLIVYRGTSITSHQEPKRSIKEFQCSASDTALTTWKHEGKQKDLIHNMSTELGQKKQSNARIKQPVSGPCPTPALSSAAHHYRQTQTCPRRIFRRSTSKPS
jgi:hypothetical protein